MEYVRILASITLLGVAILCPFDTKGSPGYLDNGVLAYYPFDGDARDKSGNGRDGRVYGATLTRDRRGKQNAAYSFNGVSDSVNIGDIGAINDISVSLWFRKGVQAGYPNSPGAGEADIFGTQSSGAEAYFKFGFHVSHPDYPMFGISPRSHSDYLFQRTTTPIKDTDWHHLVMTRRGSRVRIFIDGAEQDLVTFSSRGNPSSTIVTRSVASIGTLGGYNTDKFDGDVDDVRIYSRELSEDEVIRLKGR